MYNFSFILPTRDRVDLVERFFSSIKENTSDISNLEIIIGCDADDLASQNIEDAELNIKKIIFPESAKNMGEFNNLCYQQASGKFVMLVNDDLILRTKNWDKKILKVTADYPDDILLIHVNDLLFKEKLCCFPMVSRKACKLINNICPSEYVRYRIDDHIYDIYSQLAYIGYDRIKYLPNIIFEHKNHTEDKNAVDNQNTFTNDGKVYSANEEIMKKDVAIFDNSMADRTDYAIELVKLIEPELSKEKLAKMKAKLLEIDNPYFCRSNYHEKRSLEHTMDNFVTIGVVTANIYNEHAQKCLSLIKKYSSNYELVIIDNAGAKDFNHPKEMNRLISIAKGEYLILLDDDVYVTKGWLDGIINSFDDDIAVVTPLHTDAVGDISYSGIYFSTDGSGNHYHHRRPPKSVSPIQTICSACTAIDLKKCKGIEFKEYLPKYFLDIDYGLQVWEAGYKVVITPFSTVTHIGGATLPQGGNEKSTNLYNNNRDTFKNEWTASGKYDYLVSSVWKNSDMLTGTIELNQILNNWQDKIDKASDKGEFVANIISLIYKYDVEQYLNLIYPVLMSDAQLFSRLFKEAFFDRICKKIINNNILSPILFFTYDCYNIVLYSKYVYATPLAVGEINFTIEREREQTCILRSKSFMSLIKQIDCVTKSTDKTLLRKTCDLLKKHHMTFRKKIMKYAFNMRYKSRNLKKTTASFRREILINKNEGKVNEINHNNNEVSVLFFINKSSNPCSKTLLYFICDFSKENVIPDKLEDYSSIIVCSYQKDRTKIKHTLNKVGFELDKEESFNYSDELNLFNCLNETHSEAVWLYYGSAIDWKNNLFENLIEMFRKEFNIILLNGEVKKYDDWDDLLRIKYNKSYLTIFFNFVKNCNGKKILEVGCSDGLVCNYLLNETPETVVGIDVIDNIGSKYKSPKISYHNMDATKMNFDDNYFDIVLTIATLEHVKDPVKAISEIIRVLKPGGFCYIQSAPLYYSAYGHHMFGFFDDLPWIHLRKSKEEIVNYCKTKNIDAQAERSPDSSIEEYIDDILNVDHVNKKRFDEYKIDDLTKQNNIEVLFYAKTYEGENFYSDSMLPKYNKLDLTTHGFELVLKKKSS